MIAVITGAGRGIGKAIAKKLASMGYDLLLNSRTEQSLAAAMAEINTAYPEITVRGKAADMSIKMEAIAFAEWCLGFGSADVLVNNAGAYLPGNAVFGPDGHVEDMMNVNFYSAYYMSRYLAPSMVAQKRGHIINICSIASLQAYKNGGAYGISKYAMMGLSKNLRLELMEHHIRVTAFYLGAVDTDTWGGFDNSQERIMKAEEVAEAVAMSISLKGSAVVEDITLRPQLGDL